MTDCSFPRALLLAALAALTSCVHMPVGDSHKPMGNSHMPMGDSRRITVLSQERTAVVEQAVVDGDHLWVPEDSLPSVNGFRLEPEGLCAGDLCIPLAKHYEWTRKNGGHTYVDATAVALHLGQSWVADEARKVWSFAPVPVLTSPAWKLGQAPDFTLPDVDGRPVRLSDYRGKKVLLLTWASW